MENAAQPSRRCLCMVLLGATGSLFFLGYSIYSLASINEPPEVFAACHLGPGLYEIAIFFYTSLFLITYLTALSKHVFGRWT